MFEIRMIDKYDLGTFTFSQNYVFFYDQLEKANLFLQGVIDTKGLSFDDRKVDWLFRNRSGRRAVHRSVQPHHEVRCRSV